MNRHAIILALTVTLAIVSCAKEDKPPAPTTSSANNEATAKTAVKPGSHEDWCDEHAVPETQCTQCDPKLAAAFKATGDWCDEHGVPESHCRKCNPDLKLDRPPKAAN